MSELKDDPQSRLGDNERVFVCDDIIAIGVVHNLRCVVLLICRDEEGRSMRWATKSQ